MVFDKSCGCDVILVDGTTRVRQITVDANPLMPIQHSHPYESLQITYACLDDKEPT